MNEQIQQCCTWTEHSPGSSSYTSKCGHDFYFDSGDVGENGFGFCPYCSKPIACAPSEEGASNG